MFHVLGIFFFLLTTSSLVEWQDNSPSPFSKTPHVFAIYQQCLCVLGTDESLSNVIKFSATTLCPCVHFSMIKTKHSCEAHYTVSDEAIVPTAAPGTVPFADTTVTNISCQ